MVEPTLLVRIKPGFKRKPGPPRTALGRWLERHGMSGYQFATDLGINASTINRLIDGPDRAPGLLLALVIEEVTKGAVKPRDFYPKGKSLRKQLIEENLRRSAGQPTRIAAGDE